MSSLHALRRRWIGGLLAFIFAFCLIEAMVPEACDGDPGKASVVAAGDRSGQAPAGSAPGHGGPPLCHCVHTNGVFSDEPPPAVLAVDHHLLDSVREDHHTPAGVTQAFVYCLCRVGEESL
jgi:hypothetical protein